MILGEEVVFMHLVADVEQLFRWGLKTSNITGQCSIHVMDLIYSVNLPPKKSVNLTYIEHIYMGQF